MEIHQLKTLISNLDSSDSSVVDETKKTLIEHADNIEVLNEFLNTLHYGNQKIRENLVDVLSDIYSEQAFKLLMYAAHDTYHQVSNRVFDNLKKNSDPNEILFFIEATLSYKEGPKPIAQEQALSWIREHKQTERRKYFLPLIKDYLSENHNIDLAIRGKLLSVLAHHDYLDETEDLLDVVRHGDWRVKDYAINKLDKIINTDNRKEIYFALSEALQHEINPETRSLLEKVLHPEFDKKTVFQSIKSSSDWFAEAVLYFRKLGFFQEYNTLADDELIVKIKELRNYTPEDKFTYNTDLLLILAQDKNRVWYCDSETYWEQQYVKLFKEWGNISCGKFTPENIIESRSDDNTDIHIDFSHNGEQTKIIATYYGDWIAAEIIEDINEIIRDSGIQFCNIVTETQELCIVSLTSEQKMFLERDLGLEFDLFGRYIAPPKL